MAPTKDNIKEALDRAGVEYASDANKDELEKLAADNDVTVAEHDGGSPEDRPAASVAAPAENDALEHSDGGQTTRSDRTDAGVPMAPAEAGTTEPSGPEDALGAEPTRGDYRDRIDSGPHLASQSIPAGERDDVELKDDDDEVVGVERGAHTKLVEQRPS